MGRIGIQRGIAKLLGKTYTGVYHVYQNTKRIQRGKVGFTLGLLNFGTSVLGGLTKVTKSLTEKAVNAIEDDNNGKHAKPEPKPTVPNPEKDDKAPKNRGFRGRGKSLDELDADNSIFDPTDGHILTQEEEFDRQIAKAQKIREAEDAKVKADKAYFDKKTGRDKVKATDEELAIMQRITDGTATPEEMERFMNGDFGGFGAEEQANGGIPLSADERVSGIFSQRLLDYLKSSNTPLKTIKKDDDKLEVHLTQGGSITITPEEMYTIYGYGADEQRASYKFSAPNDSRTFNEAFTKFVQSNGIGDTNYIYLLMKYFKTSNADYMDMKEAQKYSKEEIKDDFNDSDVNITDSNNGTVPNTVNTNQSNNQSNNQTNNSDINVNIGGYDINSQLNSDYSNDPKDYF